jgi:hypothetical protein
MSFGGGSSGSGTDVPAHLHDGLVNSGGSLDSTSLINDSPIFALMVAL